MWKLSLHGDSQWISLCTQVHTPRDERPIDDYSQRSQALLIPGSRLNGRNSPGARPYCNRQSLKNFADRTKPWKFNTNIFHANFFNVKISRSTVLVSTIHTHVPRLLGALPTLRQGIVSILHACVTWLFVQTNYHRERETFKEENFHKFRDVVHVHVSVSKSLLCKNWGRVIFGDTSKQSAKLFYVKNLNLQKFSTKNISHYTIPTNMNCLSSHNCPPIPSDTGSPAITLPFPFTTSRHNSRNASCP